MVFVDENCIGCRMCESYAPAIFKIEDDWLSHVIKQPENDQEITETKTAIEGCPVAAIHQS